MSPNLRPSTGLVGDSDTAPVTPTGVKRPPPINPDKVPVSTTTPTTGTATTSAPPKTGAGATTPPAGTSGATAGASSWPFTLTGLAMLAVGAGLAIWLIDDLIETAERSSRMTNKGAAGSETTAARQ